MSPLAQALHSRAVRVHHEDRLQLSRVDPGEGDLSAVGREDWKVVRPYTLRWVLQHALIDERHKNVRVRTESRVCESPRIRRPGRIKVEPATNRHSACIRAVVVAVINLLHLPVLDRIAQPHAVTIGHPREFGACDAFQSALLVVNLIRGSVCIESRVICRPAVLLCEDRGA